MSSVNMIKQRLSRNESRFQWVEGATRLIDVLTKGEERGHVELLKNPKSDSCYLRDVGGKTAECCCDTKNVDGQTSDNIEHETPARFVIRVENIKTLMSSASAVCSTRRSELLRKYFLLLVQHSRETRGHFWSVLGKN